MHQQQRDGYVKHDGKSEKDGDRKLERAIKHIAFFA